MKTANTFITAIQARDLGLREIYFAFTGIGDQILLLAAAEQYYRKTGEKLLLACQYRQLFHGADFCWVLDSPDSEILEKIYAEHAKANKKHAGNTVTISGAEFKVKFIPALNFSINKDGRFIRRWPDKHILARLCERLGLSGEMEIAPQLRLADDEKTFGRFSEKKQIAIMAGGRVEYKHFSPEIAQRVVNAFRTDYDVVQIGGKGDPPLADARHVMGELPLRKTAAILFHSDVFVGAIGGLMHMARAVGCPSVIAFAGEPLTYEYYATNSYVFSDTPCAECPEGRRDPLFEPCPHAYRCAVNFDPDKIIEAVREKLSAPPIAIPPQIATLTPAPVSGMELWHRNRYLLAQRHRGASHAQ